MSMVGFPLLLIPLAIYNIIVFLMPGVSLAEPVAKLTLMSGAEWALTLNDLLLALGIVMLLFEVIKGARPGAKYLTDHLLSLIIFCGAAAEFLLLPRFASSTYFLLALLTLVDFLSGITLRVRRGTRMASAAPQRAQRSTTVTAEARREPQLVDPEPSTPPSASAVESLPSDQTQPRPVHPEAMAPLRDVSPPELPPGDAVQRPPDPSPH